MNKIIYISLFMFLTYNSTGQKILTIGEISKKIVDLESNKSQINRNIYYDKAKNETLYIGTGKFNTGYFGIPFKLNTYEDYKEGTVISLGSQSSGFTPSQKELDEKVIGVIGEPIKDNEDRYDYYVAITGKVKIRVVVPDSTMKISIGDLLVSSSINGVAMKAKGSNCDIIGKIIGKAMENYDNYFSEGLIDVILKN